MRSDANTFNRILKIMTLLMSQEYTAESLSDTTGIPLSVLQRDLLCLFKDNTVRSALVVGEDCDEGEASDIENEKETWLKALRRSEGKALTKGVRIDPDILTGGENGETLFVNLTPFEKNVFAKAIRLSHFSDAVWIKDSVIANGNSDTKILGPLQIAIEQNHPVSFKYMSNSGEEINERFCARCIYEVLQSGVRYCVGLSGEGRIILKRTDRISELFVHEDEEMPPLKEGALDMLDYMWGADGAKEIVHVKIKILKETKNIYEKIKTETNERKYGKLYDDPEDEGVAYYEDDVCGLNSFKKWLRSYGASVLVLEPSSLAEEMYMSAKRKLEHYREVLGN